jgi:hypothetical protein
MIEIERERVRESDRESEREIEVTAMMCLNHLELVERFNIVAC